MRARRGRGEGSVSEYEQKLKDGSIVKRWRARAIVSGGRRSVYAATKDEALKKLAALRNADRDGIDFDADRIRFGDYAKSWLTDVIKPSREANTFRQYESIVNQHLKDYFAGVRLRDIKAPMIRRMLSKMERDGKSPRLRQLARTILSAILRQAVGDDYLARNPCAAVKAIKLPHSETQSLTPEEVNALLTAARGNRFEALYHVALMTGARQGEMFALRWCDVDLEQGVVTIQRSLQEIYGGGKDGRVFECKSTKADKVRRVNLAPSTVAILREHKNRTSPKVVPMKKNHRDESFVFFTRGRSGGRVALRKSNFLRNEYRPLLKLAGIDERFHFHGLRHTCASLLLANGESVNVVAEQLGHDPAMTLRVYAHALPGAGREAVNRLEALIRDAG